MIYVRDCTFPKSRVYILQIHKHTKGINNSTRTKFTVTFWIYSLCLFQYVTTIFSYFSFYKFKQRAVINFKSTTRKGILTLPTYVSDIPDYVTVKSYTF